MTRSVLMLTAGAFFSASAAFAQQPVAIIWAGAETCGTWSTQRVQRDAASAWVLGFLSGVSLAKDKDLLHSVDAGAVKGWMDKYCVEHPLDGLTQAAWTLAGELEKRSLAP